ncbi:Uncharacterized protein GBIM_11085 [Gryllus bimaculatus]|nr:Uncharacterized protein GBIM_11085 [Gryllus bimaculatus]
MIRRGRVPKSTDGAFWHWKDLNVGIDLAFYGKVFHTVDCDAFTCEYLRSQGVELNAPEQMPDDPYSLERRLVVPAKTTVSPSLDTKLRRFLEFGGKAPVVAIESLSEPDDTV